MYARKHLSAIGIVGLLVVSSHATADDGDVQHARVLLEEARTFGVPGVTGQAAGQNESNRTQRRESKSEPLDENETRWAVISASQSLN